MCSSCTYASPFGSLSFPPSVAVARSQDVPSFGPPIPQGVTFPKSTVFRDFLLAKVINAENAAHKSDKFGAMATRTRQEYLRDLAERHVTSTPVEPTGKSPSSRWHTSGGSGCGLTAGRSSAAWGR